MPRLKSEPARALSGAAGSVVFDPARAGTMNGNAKRSRVDADELADLRRQLFDHLTTMLEADPNADGAKLAQSDATVAAATLTELGVTSTMAMALKGWVFHELEAELTTFQLMRSPTSELLELIATHRKSELGVAIPPRLERLTNALTRPEGP